MKNQIDPTQFIITNRVRCSTKYLGALLEYSTHTDYARRCDGYIPQPALNKGPCLMTLCTLVFSLKRFQIFGFHGNIYLPAPAPLPKATFPCFRLPFQVETFTPCLQRCLLAGDPPSRFSASSIQAGNPHPTPILLLLPHPTCPDRRRDTFHPNHRPLHQISAGLSHGARSIARISRSIWQQRSKSRPHMRMSSRWLPFMLTPRSWRSTFPFASYAG